MGLVRELHAPTHRFLVFFELQRFRFSADRYLKTHFTIRQVKGGKGWVRPQG